MSQTVDRSPDIESRGGARRRGGRWSLLVACLLFSVGFSVVFVALGAAAGKLGQVLIAYKPVLARVSGGVIVLLGLFILGLVKSRALYAERRFHFRKLGPFTAPVAGMAFAFGWTPCVGPFLGSILALAAAGGGSAGGALLLGVYSAGLAIPFVLSALLFASLVGAFGWLKRHFTAINYIGGILLIVMGLLLLSGKFDLLSFALAARLEPFDLSAAALRGASVGLLTSFVAGVLSFLSPCLLPLLPGYLSFISGIAAEDLTKSEV